MIDLHCHILPGIDDGPAAMEETKRMLAIAKSEGISVIAATHHFMDDNATIDFYLESLEYGIRQIQPIIEDLNLDIKIVKGAEVYISPFLYQLEGLERLCINGSRYLLLELPMLDIPQYTEEVIYQLQIRGITPIIAHPERNQRIMGNPNLFYKMVEYGALGQVNTGSITGFFGKKVQKCARILLENNMVHVVGTDAHSAGRRAPRIKKADGMLNKWLGSQTADMLINRTPAALLKDVVLEMPNPIPYRKRLLVVPFLKHRKK
jgi:protein-tyrosine phosphatase